jgi:nucleotide-binding universal stress UspA family protein
MDGMYPYSLKAIYQWQESDMFNRVLLPLDGSDLAEAVYPYAEELARKLGSEIVLFHVCEPSHKLALNMHRLYLDKSAELLRQRLDLSDEGKKAKVRAVFVHGDFTEETCRFIDENGVDLLIMVAHGFTSLRVKIMGSIIDKVFRLVKCPVMLVRTDDDHPAGEAKELISRILLPLDGSENSETAIPYAEALARGLPAEISLYRMTRKAHYSASKDDMVGDMGLGDSELDATEQQRAIAYLEEIENDIRKKKICVSSCTTLSDDPARAITDAGRDTDADLVLMTTRGQSGITAWAPGSIAHKLLQTGDLPLLIVRKK